MPHPELNRNAAPEPRLTGGEAMTPTAINSLRARERVMTHARDRDLADLIRELDAAFEMLSDTPPNPRGFTSLRVRDRSSLLAVLQRAADFLHEFRHERFHWGRA